MLTEKVSINRGVAQFGRALRSGRRGRRFESCRLDHAGCSYRISVSYKDILLFYTQTDITPDEIFLNFGIIIYFYLLTFYTAATIVLD